LLDSNGKKIRFLRQITADMKLSNVKPIQARIEDPEVLQQLGQFDVVTSRAFASLTDFVTLGEPFVSKAGVLAAMKGQIPLDEMQQLTDYTQQTIELKVPNLDEQRHLIILSRQADQA
jgi:16S rRNA (guanine527-N7)-methyltransferase